MNKKLGLLVLCVLLTVAVAVAQDVHPALRPPKGASVAIVIFEDLECPDCARAAPLLEEAARTYKIPVVRHDFPLQMHPWAYDAAILARYFDTHSKAMGNEFRDTVFKHQLEITKETLRPFAEKFAAAHKIELPFVVDPDGKFAKLIEADRAAGNQLNLQHTPTLYVVSKTYGHAFRGSCGPQPAVSAYRYDEERVARSVSGRFRAVLLAKLLGL